MSPPTKGSSRPSRGGPIASRIVRLYVEGGTSPEDIAEKLGTTRRIVRRTLLEAKVMRRQGRPSIPPEEVERRKRLALTVRTWEEYGTLVGVKNPRLDHRLGVRLPCWFHPGTPSVGSSIVGDPTGAARPVCAACRRKYRRKGAAK